MTFEQQWIEYDFNPFILFSASGKVLSVNAEGQYLLGAVDRHTLFELATTYASPSFGFKTTFMELEYGRFKIFGIMVGYVTEEEIGIRFFQTPSFQFTQPEIEGNLVNIYSLIDLCIATNSIGSKSEFAKDLDPTMPETRLNTDQLRSTSRSSTSRQKDYREAKSARPLRYPEMIPAASPGRKYHNESI
ncbi:MAG: hypothetical protein P8Y65_07670 [Campylobacterales bacterium]